MRVARRYVIQGRVQRVGFRYFTYDAARVENLHGWVRNRPDGSVEVLAEGEAESLERFEHKLRVGPPASRVEHVDVTDHGASGRDTGFDVR